MRDYFLYLVIICILLFAVPCKADIFVKQMPDGTLEFSNCPRGVDWEIYVDEKEYGTDASNHSIDSIIDKMAEKYAIDSELIRAVIKVESEMDPYALSRKGAIGLMQIMPDTALDMGIGNPWDPEQNVQAGTRYLAMLLTRYNGDLKLALAAYNAGPTLVSKYHGIPPFEETREYVKKVLAYTEGSIWKSK